MLHARGSDRAARRGQFQRQLGATSGEMPGAKEFHPDAAPASLEFPLNAVDFFYHRLCAIRSGTDSDGARYARCTEGMYALVAPSYGLKNVVPFSRHIRAVRV